MVTYALSFSLKTAFADDQVRFLSSVKLLCARCLACIARRDGYDLFIKFFFRKIISIVGRQPWPSGPEAILVSKGLPLYDVSWVVAPAEAMLVASSVNDNEDHYHAPVIFFTDVPTESAGGLNEIRCSNVQEITIVSELIALFGCASVTVAILSEKSHINLLTYCQKWPPLGRHSGLESYNLTLCGHIKPQSSCPLYSNTVIGTLAVGCYIWYNDRKRRYNIVWWTKLATRQLFTAR